MSRIGKPKGLVGLLMQGARVERGVSQGELAKILGLQTAQSVSNIERGASPLPVRHIRKLARRLRLSRATIIDAMTNDFRRDLERRTR